MTAQKGAAFLLKISNGASPAVYQTVAGLRTTQMSVTGETVAITSKDSAGWRELLSGAGVRAVSVSAAGIFLGSAAEAKVRANALAGTLDAYELSFEDGEKLPDGDDLDSLADFGEDDDAAPRALDLDASVSGLVRVAGEPVGVGRDEDRSLPAPDRVEGRAEAGPVVLTLRPRDPGVLEDADEVEAGEDRVLHDPVPLHGEGAPLVGLLPGANPDVPDRLRLRGGGEALSHAPKVPLRAHRVNGRFLPFISVHPSPRPRHHRASRQSPSSHLPGRASSSVTVGSMSPTAKPTRRKPPRGVRMTSAS